ncbi:zinc ribbon domain-containing protein [Streptomyces sp. NPDC001492]
MTEAERPSAGISLEERKGIRQRARLRKPVGVPPTPLRQWGRVALRSWAFAQLGDFIVYKAKRAGVLLVFVDSAYTSQTWASAATSTVSTGSPKPSSYAGRAASLRTPTGTLPTSSPAGARTRGLRGVSHASLPPRRGVWTEEPTPAASWALPPSPVLWGRVTLTAIRSVCFRVRGA